MSKKITVILYNAEGCGTEILTPFPDFPQSVRIKRGQKIKISVPITCRLAEYKMLVIRKNEQGDSVPTAEERRSERELKKIRKLREKYPETIPTAPPGDYRTRRGVLSKLEK